MAPSVSYFIFLSFRLLCYLCTYTYFVPDEYFQCNEVAYHLVYGRGHVSWEWRTPAIRSVLHPGIVAAGYSILKFLGLDSPRLIRELPSVMHSIFFAIGDVYFLKLARRLFFANSFGFRLTMVIYLSNWFIIYCSSRALANSVELVLVIIALNYYPLYDDEVNPVRRIERHRERPMMVYVILGTLSIVLRPTAVLIWAPLGLYHLWRTNDRISVFAKAVVACSSTLTASILIDSGFRYPPSFPLLHFVIFNVIQNGNALFGVNPFYWYATDGLMTVSAGYCYVALFGALLCLRRPEQVPPRSPPLVLFFVCVLYVLVHSLLPHKEHRFMLPILPLLVPFGTVAVQYWHSRAPGFVKGAVCCYFVGNLLAALLLLVFHQRGTLDAARDIAHDISLQAANQRKYVVQLMPCYSMPQDYFFHDPSVKHYMLDCSPNLLQQKGGIANAKPDDSERFHANPLGFLKSSKITEDYLMQKRAYIVMYKKTHKRIASKLSALGYRTWRSYAHTLVPVSSHQDTQVVVLKRSSNAA